MARIRKKRIRKEGVHEIREDDLPGTVQRSSARVKRAFVSALSAAYAKFDSDEQAYRFAMRALRQRFTRVGDHWEPMRRSTQHKPKPRHRAPRTDVPSQSLTSADALINAVQGGSGGDSKLWGHDVAPTHSAVVRDALADWFPNESPKRRDLAAEPLAGAVERAIARGKEDWSEINQTVDTIQRLTGLGAG
jgi:ChaB